MKTRLICCLMFLVVAGGCGQKSNSLSRSKAARVIQDSNAFKQEVEAVYYIYGKDTSIVSSGPEYTGYKALDSLGYAKITYNQYKSAFIELTDKGKEAVSSGKWKEEPCLGGFESLRLLKVGVSLVKPPHLHIEGAAP